MKPFDKLKVLYRVAVPYGRLQKPAFKQARFIILNPNNSVCVAAEGLIAVFGIWLWLGFLAAWTAFWMETKLQVILTRL